MRSAGHTLCKEATTWKVLFTLAEGCNKCIIQILTSLIATINSHFVTNKHLNCISFPHLSTNCHAFTYFLSYPTEQSRSWEANLFSARQEILRILWNPQVHYCIYKCLSLVPVLGQINPVHVPHPTSWISILILSSHLRLGLPSGRLPSGFPTTTLYTTLLSTRTCYMPRHSHSSRFDHPNNIWWGYPFSTA
jgi:hypothetical protein